jgi:hypothetical protein
MSPRTSRSRFPRRQISSCESETGHAFESASTPSGRNGVSFPPWRGRVSVLVSAVFALLAWMPAYATLSDAARIEFAWVLPATIALGALGLLLGGGMFWGAHLIGSDERLTASQIVEEMDDIHPIVA